MMDVFCNNHVLMTLLVVSGSINILVLIVKIVDDYGRRLAERQKLHNRISDLERRIANPPSFKSTAKPPKEE